MKYKGQAVFLYLVADAVSGRVFVKIRRRGKGVPFTVASFFFVLFFSLFFSLCFQARVEAHVLALAHFARSACLLGSAWGRR